MKKLTNMQEEVEKYRTIYLVVFIILILWMLLAGLFLQGTFVSGILSIIIFINVGVTVKLYYVYSKNIMVSAVMGIAFWLLTNFMWGIGSILFFLYLYIKTKKPKKGVKK